MWEDVAYYIECTYKKEEIETAFIMGDGASYIKAGTEWIGKSVFVLDTFHLEKYINNLGMMRGLPNMTVMCTSDDRETKWAVEEISKMDGPVYLRLCRLNTPQIYGEEQDFKIGKGVQIGNGTDATVFATGVVVPEAIKAKEELEKQGINIRVVDIHTIKPIDKELIIKCAKETKKLVSIEDHNIIGGLGSAISEVLTEEYPAKLIRMGMKDRFGESGPAKELLRYFGLTSEDIIAVVK